MVLADPVYPAGALAVGGKVEVDAVGIVGEALVRADRAMLNIEEGKCCEMFELCREFLTPAQFEQCANGENLCSKSEMVSKRLMVELLNRFDGR